MTEQARKLIKNQKVWGISFILFFSFSLCMCTPLSPAPLLEKIVGPILAGFAPFLSRSDMVVMDTPFMTVPRFLTILFGAMGGCFISIITFFGFIFVTVLNWYSEIKLERKNSLKLQQMHFELEKQRFELEKQRLELEMQRQMLGKTNNE